MGLDFAIDFPKLDRSLADKAGGISAAMSYPAFETRPQLHVAFTARFETERTDCLAQDSIETIVAYHLIAFWTTTGSVFLMLQIIVSTDFSD